MKRTLVGSVFALAISLAILTPAAAAEPIAGGRTARSNVDDVTTAAIRDQQYGPYGDLGTCNYWRAAVAAANPGHYITQCLRNPGTAGGWIFWDWGPAFVA